VNCRIYAPKCHVCHEAIIPSQVIICMDFVLYHLFAAPSKLDDDYTMIVIMRMTITAVLSVAVTK